MTRTRYGRPKFDLLFSSMKERIETGNYLPGRESSLKTTVGGESIQSLRNYSLTFESSFADSF